MPTDAGTTARAFRDSTLGKVLALAVILLLALVVAKACRRADLQVSQAQAIEIAKGEIDYAPRCTLVHVLNRGLKSRSTWAISLSKPLEASDLAGRWAVTVVQVDGKTGVVVQIDEGFQDGVRC